MMHIVGFPNQQSQLNVNGVLNKMRIFKIFFKIILYICMNVYVYISDK